ncbi:hypothetical protein AB0I72_26875 [Nocardiopsis sp. NPDC049922]|uniref:hypothetical protein n=1 Tax=Nocardiopsis sp. NPDC049922 TaxID=3155157 RepID=UPI0033C2DD75
MYSLRVGDAAWAAIACSSKSNINTMCGDVMRLPYPSVFVDDSSRETVSLSTRTPPEALKEALYRISLSSRLPGGLIASALSELLHAQPESARDHYLAVLMTGLMARGPREDEVVELLEAALTLDPVTPVSANQDGHDRLVVLAGSGKKGLKTFNISTCSAIIAAAAGARIVKVGSYATSSVLGSRDFATRIGLPQQTDGRAVLDAVARHGFSFAPVEEMIPALDRVYGGRFHVLTPFSFGLAALASPVRGDVLIFGLAHPRVDLAAAVLARFGIRDALIVSSGTESGRFADELGVGDWSLVCELRDGTVGEVRRHSADALPGASSGRAEPVRAPRSSDEAFNWALEALGGRGTTRHIDILALNAGFLLNTARIVSDIAEGYDLALNLITSGRAVDLLRELCAGPSEHPWAWN